MNIKPLSLTVAALMLLGTGLLFPVGVPAAEAQVIAKGQFSGRSGHKVSGTVEIVKTASGFEVRFADNFKIDGAPGPYLGFGKNGKYVFKTEFSKLRKKRGKQSYTVPSKIAVTEYDTFFIWCKPYKVPLAIAKLDAGPS